MIHGVYANQTTFQNVEFTTGLNVIVADRSEESSQKDTRNALGKSTLIDIIDFCLGASTQKGKGICIDALEGWVFTLEITLAGNRVRASRAVDFPRLILIEGPTDGWIEQPDLDDDNIKFLELPQWRYLLGWAMFGLLDNYETFKYKPSYRSLISYFVRNGSSAYLEPFKHVPQQQTWDMQLHVSLLLGLNWEYASQWQVLRDRDDALKAIDKAIKTGALEGIIGTVGELEAERVRLESIIDKDHNALESFRVHPQYEKIQSEANNLTKKIHELTNRNVVERRRLSRYQDAVKEESPPNDSKLDQLYEEIGFVFPDSVIRTLEDATAFHQKIVINRKEYLDVEINRIKDQIKKRKSLVNELTDERADQLRILDSHGALQELTILRERHLELMGKLDRVQSRITEIRDISKRKRDIRRAKEDLANSTELDLKERITAWESAIRLFNENSEALYESPGRLAINVSEKSGYKFDVEIEGSDSEGISRMKIYCFDLMLLQLQREWETGIDFLIHDSIIFDPVDSRQRALALERAAEITDQMDKQYICTINSDMIPKDDFSSGFNFQNYVRLRLTDTDPSGSLLGIRF